LTDTTATLLGGGTSGVQTGCLWPHATLSSGTIYVWHGEQNDRLENNNLNVNTIQEAGTVSAESVYEGGYNRTDMSTLDDDGMAVYVVSNFTGACIGMKNYTELRNCIFIGHGVSSTAGVTFTKMKNVAFIGGAPGQFATAAATDCRYENVIIAGYAYNAEMNIYAPERTRFINTKITCARITAYLCEGLQLENIWVSRSTAYGIIFATGSCRQGYNVSKLKIANAATADLRCSTAGTSIKIWDATLGGSTKISTTAGCIMVQNYGGDTSAVLGSAAGLIISRDTSVVDGTAESSLKLLVNTTTASSLYPLYWQGPTYKHPASISGASVTVSMRIKKSHATNILGRLEVKRGVIISADAVTDIPSDTNWNTVSVTFTPSSDGKIEVYFEIWATSSTDYVLINPKSLTVTVS
jgi:hypothetical protein